MADILDDAQYQNFFRNLAEIVNSGLPTAKEKKEALLQEMANRDDTFDIDNYNLCEFVSWWQDKPLLGLATTGELLEELTARARVSGTIDYRTTDGD
jgi:hypothetical protein